MVQSAHRSGFDKLGVPWEKSGVHSAVLLRHYVNADWMLCLVGCFFPDLVCPGGDAERVAEEAAASAKDWRRAGAAPKNGSVP